VKEVVGRPIVFASTGEKLGDLDLFHPDRMADRILGMGDMLTLIEQAERTMDEEVVARSASRLLSGRFTLEDFLEQLQQVRKLGSFGGIMKLMPGMSKEVRAAADQIDDREVNRVEAIVRSMTPAERSEPAMVDGSRRLRIAQGSGTSTQDVNQLLKQFKEMQKMMRGAGGPGGMGAMGRLGGLLGGRPGGVGGLPAMGGPGGGGDLSELLSGVSAPGTGVGSGDPRFALPARSARVPTQGGPKNKKKKGGRVTPPKAR
jgi:signal recognition particle subunit SRP54